MRIVISVPNSVFRAAQRTSKRLRMSRSQLYSKAVEVYVKEHSGDDTTERLDAICAKRSSRLDPALEALSLEVWRREKW